jgi:isoleucyl-tRNA synthetase
MWSPVEKTALAEAEIEYEDITSTQIDVAFEIVESPVPELIGARAVIWTTTPWTIPVNQGIAYGPDVEYVLAEFQSGMTDSEPRQRILVAKALLEQVENRLVGSLTHVRHLHGSDLAGAIARHPMHRLGGFFAKPRPFLAGDFVTTDQGTGLVHMAPDHGEDDFELCKANGIDPVFAVDAAGFYRPDWLWLGGQGSVINNKFNAPDGPICTDLREAGALLAASADFVHSYPHSWRSKAKVIYRCTPQWFVAMDRPLPQFSPITRAEQRWENEGGEVNELCDDRSPTLRELALNAIAQTRFVPEKGRNRIGSMVEGRPDWVLSRQRAWGVPIALFVDRKSGHPLVDHEVNQRIVDASAIRASMPGMSRMRPPSSATAIPTITRWSPTSWTSGSTADRPTPSSWKAAAGPTSAGPPTSISKAPTSTVAGSSRRFSRAAERAAGRRSMPS